MKVYYSGDRTDSSIALLGMFDGMHKGHRTLAEKAVSLGCELNLPVIMYTFDVNPKSVKKRLMSNEAKIERCSKWGIDGIYFETFDEKFRRTLPSEFISNVLENSLNVKAVVVGDDYRFGYMGNGTPEMLSGNGFDVYVMPQLKEYGIDISSSAIRALIEQCKISEANELLGYTYSLEGEVVHGRGVGRTFGVCTANIEIDPAFVLPGDGVYITKVFVDGKSYKSLTNIGFKPTFGLDFRTVEVHIMGFDGDLYGKPVKLEFEKFLRREVAFESPDELKAQIQKDISELERYYER